MTTESTEDVAAGQGTNTDPASAAAPPSRRSALLRSGLILGVLVVVFLVILPQYIDYAEVVDAFQALTPAQIVVMTILGAIAWFASGLVFVALIPGLQVVRGAMSWLILAGIGASVPFGPWNMGVLWVIVRGWGIGNAAATSGVALYGVVNILGRLFLPLFAIIVLAVTGQLSAVSDTDKAWTIAVISAVVFVLATGLLVAIVRSERIADWLGRTGQRAVDWVVQRLGRSGSPNVAGSIHRFRDQLGLVIRRRGFAAMSLAILSQFAWTFVLVAAMRVCGVPDDVLTVGAIFGVYALVMVITIIPLSPGGAGVPELLFISAFSTLAGPEYQSQVTAGVFLYRLYFWFVPIPIAWVLLKVARRGKPMLPSTTELREYSRGDAGASGGDAPAPASRASTSTGAGA
jgi:uncharacterized membrane protein YbhN (UPF0104 family)